MTSLLINHKTKLNQSGGENLTTPLQEASANGHIDIVSQEYIFKPELFWRKNGSFGVKFFWLKNKESEQHIDVGLKSVQMSVQNLTELQV